MNAYQAERFRRIVDAITLGGLGACEVIYLIALFFGYDWPAIIEVGVAFGAAFMAFELWLLAAIR